MFALDIPVAPPPEPPVLLAQVPAGGTAIPDWQPDYLFKACKATESTGDPRSAMRAIDPAGMLQVYFENYLGRRNIDLIAIKTTLIDGAKRGVITEGRTRDESLGPVRDSGRTVYGYDATPDYEGRDRAVFMAEFEGKRYKIVIDLRVFKQVNEYAPVCPKPQLIQVKKPHTSLAPEQTSLSFADLEGAER